MGKSGRCKAEKGTCWKNTTWHLLQAVYQKTGEGLGRISHTRDSPCSFRKRLTFCKGEQRESGCQGMRPIHITVVLTSSLAPPGIPGSSYRGTIPGLHRSCMGNLGGNWSSRQRWSSYCPRKTHGESSEVYVVHTKVS